MSNNGTRIVLDRREGGLWHWQLNASGEQHIGKRGEATAVDAAQAAETFRSHLDLAMHFKKQKLAERNQNDRI